MNFKIVCNLLLKKKLILQCRNGNINMNTFGGLVQLMKNLLIHLHKLNRLTTKLQTYNRFHNNINIFFVPRVNEKRVGIQKGKLVVHHTLALQNGKSHFENFLLAVLLLETVIGKDKNCVLFVG